MVPLQKNKLVLTRYGYGTIQKVIDESQLKVKLKRTFAGRKVHIIEMADFVQVTAHALLSVVNLSGYGLASNCVFMKRELDALTVWNAPHSIDHTIFFLNLKKNRFRANRKLGILGQDYLLVSGWCDRWGIEEIRRFDNLKDAKASFRKIIATTVGSGGIILWVLLDMKNQTIVRTKVLTAAGFSPVE